MKLLFIFLDAIRGDLSNLKNSKIAETELEVFLKKIGGNYYKNAYTVAPDTIRSFATIRSGMYPKKNGCLITSTSHSLFLKNKMELFSYLIKKEFNIYILTNKFLEERETFNNLERIKLFYEMDNLKKEYLEDDSQNKVFFIHCFDYHELALHENTIFQEKKARNKIGNIMDNLIADIEQEFDKVIIFSDHGYTLETEKEGDYWPLSLGRTNVILQLRNNKEERKKIKIKEELVSLLDIFPTIVSWFEDEKKYKFDGISLNKKHEETLYIEDGFTDPYGKVINVNEHPEMYRIKIINKEIEKEFNLKELNDLRLKNRNFYDVIESKVCHLKIVIQLYNIQLQKYKYKKFSILENNTNDNNINRYDRGGNVKYYIDGSKIQKKDYYGKNSNSKQCKSNKERIKKYKKDMKVMIVDLIRIILAYLHLYNFCIELNKKWRNK